MQMHTKRVRAVGEHLEEMDSVEKLWLLAD